MRLLSFACTFAVGAWICVMQPALASAAITYVDATAANTTLNGAPLALGENYTSDPAMGGMDNFWHLRTEVGNGGSVWTADESNVGTEEVAPLVTTVSFPQAGAYRIFVYVWDSEDPGADWDVRLRLGNSGPFSRIHSSDAESAAAASFSASILVQENTRRLIQIPLGIVVVAAGGSAQVFVDDDGTADLKRTWYDGIGYEKVFTSLDERIISIDFNKSNAPAAPSQAMFRSIRGSHLTSQNTTNIVKMVGPYSLQLTKTTSLPFDFRGANGDGTRLIPGGSTSLSFLVADLIGSRDGTINLRVSNLPQGSFLFRSYHLDTFFGSNFGFAQGSSSTNANILRAHIGGALQGLVQPTALGPVGLATNFISDADIPKLAFPFQADGINPVTINLSTVYSNGTDRFIFMNGFEIFSTTP